jgi:hypothetical protein
MVDRIQLPRLSRSDVEELGKAHVALAAVDAMLRDSKWAGAIGAIALVGQADQVIARLYNKAEASVIRQTGSPAPETPPGAPAEQRPGESTGQEKYGALKRPET